MRATTRCKVPIVLPGNACGLVFRFHDPANHYVAQLDAGAGLVALRVVRAGIERTIQEHPAEITGGVWQELAVEAHAGRIVVSWNGRDVIDARDRTLSSPGEVGLWAPASGAATFDELSVEAMAAFVL